MYRSLKIANWNIERINPTQRRASAIKDHISKVGADLWFLTETHEDVRPGAKFFSTFSGEPDRTSRSGERWVGLFSRWPMTPLSEFVCDTSRCTAGHIPESPFGELVLYGTVLPWTNAWRGIPGANAEAFEAALSRQRQDWQSLARNFPDATMIVAGDFNQDLAPRHYYGSHKKRHLLELAFDEAGLLPLTSGINDPIARDSAPYGCIDHICISKAMGWKLAHTSRWPDSATPVRNLSDHFGISVELDR